MTRLLLATTVIAGLISNWDAASAGDRATSLLGSGGGHPYASLVLLHHHTKTRSLDGISNPPFSDWFCVFGARRVCHEWTVRPRRIRLSSDGAYGADTEVRAVPVQQHARQHVPKAAVLAKRQLTRKPTATEPRPADAPAGADYERLRYDVLKACWDQVEEFMKWREGR